MPSDMTLALRRLGLMKRRETILKDRVKKATKARVEQEHVVWNLMEGEGYRAEDNDGVKLGGIYYSPERTEFAVVQNREDVVAWAKEYDDSIIGTDLKQGELNRIVREKLDNGEPLPPGLGYHTKPWISTKGLKATINKEDA